MTFFRYSSDSNQPAINRLIYFRSINNFQSVRNEYIETHCPSMSSFGLWFAKTSATAVMHSVRFYFEFEQSKLLAIIFDVIDSSVIESLIELSMELSTATQKTVDRFIERAYLISIHRLYTPCLTVACDSCKLESQISSRWKCHQRHIHFHYADAIDRMIDGFSSVDKQK